MNLSTSSLAGPVLATAAIAFLAAGCGTSSGTSADNGAGAGSGSSSSAVSVGSFNGTHVLVDSAGHSLYSASAEKGGHILCVGGCTSFWKPVSASGADAKAADKAVGAGFSVVDRAGRGSQLTYHGLPLYTFAEEGAGELQGDGLTDDFNGTHFVWDAARAPGSSAAPSPTSQPQDSGGGYGY